MTDKRKKTDRDVTIQITMIVDIFMVQFEQVKLSSQADITKSIFSN